MKIVFEGEYFGNILTQIKEYVAWANKKDPQDKIDDEVQMDVVSYIQMPSGSDSAEYYIVTTVENLAVACTCKGFHFRNKCSHIEGYNGSRA